MTETVMQYLEPAALIGGAFLLGFIVYWITFRLFSRYGDAEEMSLVYSINRNLKRPARLFIPLLFALVSIPFSGLGENLAANLSQGLEILLYIVGAWLVIECTDVVGDMIRREFRLDVEDNLSERKVITQVQYIKRLVGVIVTLVALSFILMQFEKVRELGAGLLTSAGIAGIVIGIAAQRPIANLLAGFLIAFTQPIRIDDVVIVEGEWGRIEEITMSYVVVRIWDQRRLVLPLTYFVEKPFQNWTRTSADILGTVFIYTDYHMPVENLRNELTRILKGSDLWDRRVNVLQVTDSKERTMEIRALMSARNSSEAWDLRCLVRERLIAFIQREYPHCLPRTRVELPREQDAWKSHHREKPNEEGHNRLSSSPDTSVDKPSE